jgi:hypothetical protein
MGHRAQASPVHTCASAARWAARRCSRDTSSPSVQPVELVPRSLTFLQWDKAGAYSQPWFTDMACPAYVLLTHPSCCSLMHVQLPS